MWLLSAALPIGCRKTGTLPRPAGSACNDLAGVDRVALLFLSLGALPQDAVWAAWLDRASGLVPVQPLQVLNPTLQT